jgi:hypothetical protein
VKSLPELPSDLWNEVFIQYAKDYFSSFQHLVETGAHHGEEVDKKVRSLMIHWSNIMLDFFLDMKQLGILPREKSEKYPSEHLVQFILSYVLGKSLPYSYATTYHNMDLRKTIQRSLDNRIIKMAQG